MGVLKEGEVLEEETRLSFDLIAEELGFLLQRLCPQSQDLVLWRDVEGGKGREEFELEGLELENVEDGLKIRLESKKTILAHSFEDLSFFFFVALS